MPTDLITLSSSDIIAIISALIAALSAIYARWASVEAKRANEISLLGHRKVIFDAFFELKIHMDQRGTCPDIKHVSKFYYPSRDAAVYFEKELSKKVSSYYSKCFKAADLARLGNALDPSEHEEIKNLCKSAALMAGELEDLMSSVIKRCATNG
ncbi:hypothetical protein [Balneatrix alpica]|uniref:hypothetical protein n=1 Tax=Balneatrix alpica TaxID=75684 RepID=UPI0027399FC7|nr:hypothetical protein [Balneatrix alpica]